MFNITNHFNNLSIIVQVYTLGNITLTLLSKVIKTLLLKIMN